MTETLNITATENKFLAVNVIEYNTGTPAKLIFDNETFEILHCNEEAARIFGYSANELLRLKVTDICIDDFSALVDTGNVGFPIDTLTRLILCKSGALLTSQTEESEVDFDTTMLEFNSIIALNNESIIYSLLEHMM